ncbi:hypothetical protein ACP275_14G295600 [Erythranthe tilingii]
MADQSPPSHSPNSVSNEPPNIVVEYADSLNVKEMVVKSCQGMKLKTVFTVFNAALRAINKCESEVAIGTEMIEYFNEQFGRRWNCIVENHGGIPEQWVGDDDYIVFMAQNTHFSLYRTQAVRSPNRSRSPKSGESVCSNNEEVDSILVSYPSKSLTVHSCYEMEIMMIVSAFNSMLELPDNDIDVLVNRLKTLFDQVYIGHGHWICVAGSAFLTVNPPDWTGAELLVCSVGDKMICLYRASKKGGGSGNEPGDGADDGADDDEEAEGDGDEPSLIFSPNDEEQDNSSEDDESISESDDDEGEEKNNTCEEYESNSYIDAEEEQEEYDTTEGHDSTSEFDEVEEKEEIDTSEEDEEDTEFDDEEEQAENSINEEEEYGDNEDESEAHNEEEVYDTTSEEEEYGDNEASDESKSDNEEEDNTDSEEEEYGDNEASDESKSDNEEEDNTDSEEEEYGDEASDEEDDD